MSAAEQLSIEPSERVLTPAMRSVIAQLEDSNPSIVHSEVKLLPTDVYTSTERFAEEQAKLFKRRPIPVTVSAELPAPKTHITNDDYDVPLLLTRDETGKVHAFINVCRHRAVKLCQNKETKSGGLLVCPYHAWSYNLKGELKSIPRQEVFPGVEKKDHGLIELECLEAGGVIWVGFNRESATDFSGVTDSLAADFDAIGMGRQKIYRKARVELNANWKLVHDAFSENYHVTRLHSESLKGMFVDRKTVCERVGPHLVSMSGRAGYKQTDDIATYEEFRKSLVACYTVVPGAIVITSPSYISVMLLSPKAPGLTVINYYMLIDHLPETEKQEQHFERSFNLMKRLTIEEDFWVSELGQRGAEAGAVPYMTLGGMEQDIVRFHEAVNEGLAD